MDVAVRQRCRAASSLHEQAEQAQHKCIAIGSPVHRQHKNQHTTSTQSPCTHRTGFWTKAQANGLPSEPFRMLSFSVTILEDFVVHCSFPWSHCECLQSEGISKSAAYTIQCHEMF